MTDKATFDKKMYSDKDNQMTLLCNILTDNHS